MISIHAAGLPENTPDVYSYSSALQANSSTSFTTLPPALFEANSRLVQPLLERDVPLPPNAQYKTAQYIFSQLVLLVLDNMEAVSWKVGGRDKAHLVCDDVGTSAPRAAHELSRINQSKRTLTSVGQRA